MTDRRPQPNYSNTHSTSLPAKNVNSHQVSHHQVKKPLAFLLCYKFSCPMSVSRRGGGGGGGSGGGGWGRVSSINKYNPLKLAFQMDVCLTVVEEMPLVDMPLPATSIN